MKKNNIHILVTFDKNYISPFRTMLKSLVTNNPHENFHVWLLHSAIPEEEIHLLEIYCKRQMVDFTALQIDRAFFKNAPITKRYPQEMYYRLLAPQLLPDTLDKILYLDPDILVINSVRPLWDILLDQFVFAAASHTGVTNMTNDVNQLRLGTNHDYYNTGVMLIDLKKARNIINSEEIFSYVTEHDIELILPDQDVFNALYGTFTKQIPDEIWNYDARNYSTYLLMSHATHNIDWLMQNTVILHFCGKNKPWKTGYPSRFNALYKHYMNLAAQ